VDDGNVRIQISFVVSAIALLSVVLVSCSSGRSQDKRADAASDVSTFLLTESESPGWTITPDEGEVSGDSPDCTGAPFDWPDSAIAARASQFLDRPDETVAVVLKRLDAHAAVHVDAVRRAMQPCFASAGLSSHGAMIARSGDDSFAYQAGGSDESGDYQFSNMVIACGDLLLETMSISYSNRLDQAAIESLVAPVVARLVEDQECE